MSFRARILRFFILFSVIACIFLSGSRGKSSPEAGLYAPQISVFFPHRQALALHLSRLCVQYDFDPAFILSLIQVESQFRWEAVSPRGAVGLMQLMPQTAQEVAQHLGFSHVSLDALSHLLKNPFINLSIGFAYLSYLRERYQGHSPFFTVAAYFLGPTRADGLFLRKSFRSQRARKYYESILRGEEYFRLFPVTVSAIGA